jgi:hypothetical protein
MLQKIMETSDAIVSPGVSFLLPLAQRNAIMDNGNCWQDVTIRPKRKYCRCLISAIKKGKENLHS